MPRSANPTRPLSERQERFIAEYLLDFNQTQAAIRAGYSLKSASVVGFHLLRHPVIAARVQEHRDRVRKALDERIELTTERTIQTLADLAYFDPLNMVNSDGTPKNIQQMDRASRMAIQGFEVTSQWVGKGETRRKVVTTKVRLASRASAIDMAAKVAGAYAKDNEQRRNARELSDEEIKRRLAELLGGESALTPPEGATLQ
jgi:phage terminase small subunit